MSHGTALRCTPSSTPEERTGDPTGTSGILSAGGPAGEEGARCRGPWAVVLAGGEGTRLQSFVRHVLGHARPKQFCRIVGSRSMLRHTWDRAARVVDPGRIVTIVTAGQERYLDEEARMACRGPVS